ncbi:MAG: N-acetyl-gamma-glutamyl-phosphate reductase, partial [Candidatus Micrarchaeota archaeon]|nr:N-acetyl-gamma-glutamyl-phosphate reductase [Candidatus Micrarchaeota archaeon]
MPSKKPIRVAIAGASGYLGGELLRLLLPRNDVKVTAIASQSNEGKSLGDIHPHLAHISTLKFSGASPAQLAKENDAVFFALPHGVSMDSVAQAAAANPKCKLIDLSGDFRLPEANVYEKYYKTTHQHPQLLKEAVYGLPELSAGAKPGTPYADQRKKISSARLISSPGCFSTTSILAIRPF